MTLFKTIIHENTVPALVPSHFALRHAVVPARVRVLKPQAEATVDALWATATTAHIKRMMNQDRHGKQLRQGQLIKCALLYPCLPQRLT